MIAYEAVYYGQSFAEPGTPDRSAITGIHTMFGFSVLILVLPRLIWKLINVRPDSDPVPRWQRITANLNHGALYFVMIAMPLAGWMGFGGRSINMFWLFEVPTFRHTELFAWLVDVMMGLTFEVWVVPIYFFH